MLLRHALALDSWAGRDLSQMLLKFGHYEQVLWVLLILGLLKVRHNQKLGVEWNEHLKYQKAL